jgi:hypothetical protein
MLLREAFGYIQKRRGERRSEAQVPPGSGQRPLPSTKRSQAEATRIHSEHTVTMRFNQHRKVNLMKPLKLYKIEPIGLPAMHLAARSEEQAMQMYVTCEAAQELSGRSFSVELVPLDGFDADQQLQIEALLAASTEGIACYDQDEGWVIDTDGWAAFDPSEVEHTGALMVFQMRDLTPIEALVLAVDYDRASALFGQHLLAHGGDPDALMYRELELPHLEDDARNAVEEALGLGREGLVVCDTADQWAFVTPLGGGKTLDENK